MITFYASKCHDRLNGKPFRPELFSEGLMVNPLYPNVTIPDKINYIVDSGAFQDVKTESRLTFSAALDRQLKFIKKIGYPAEAIVSYDRLVDEQVKDGQQIKERVSEDVGWEYVEETIKAAEYLNKERGRIQSNLILSNQGTTVKQYVQCVENILDISNEGDIIGIGGFCIMRQNKQYKQDYLNILKEILPKISEKTDRIHIFGMSIFDILIRTEIMAAKYGIDCSYDTSSAEVNSVFGRVFNPEQAQLTQVFDRNEKYNLFHPAVLSELNIQNITDFWTNYNWRGMI